MRDAFWTLAAFLLVIFSLLLSYLLTKKSVISKEGGRKLVHMLVSFTVPMIVCGIENPLLRLAGPFVFMIVNGAAGRKMGGRTAGLVCYPLSILLRHRKLCAYLIRSEDRIHRLYVNIITGNNLFHGTIIKRNRFFS